MPTAEGTEHDPVDILVGSHLVAKGFGLAMVESLERIDGEETVTLMVLDGSRMRLQLPFADAADVLRVPMQVKEAAQFLAELKKRGAPDRRGWDDRYFDYARTLAKGSLEEQVAHLRTMYSSEFKPSFAERRMIDNYELRLHPELAHVLSQPLDEFTAAIRGTSHVFGAETTERPPEPERVVERIDGPAIGGYSLLGSFLVEAGLVVADPIRVSSKSDAEPGLNVVLRAASGTWWAYVKEGKRDGLPRALIALHRDRIGRWPRGSVAALRFRSENVATVRVDSGHMAVLDREVRDDERYKDQMLYGDEMGTVLGRGCTSRSGFGDGTYQVAAVMDSDEAVFVRVGF